MLFFSSVAEPVNFSGSGSSAPAQRGGKTGSGPNKGFFSDPRSGSGFFPPPDPGKIPSKSRFY